MTGSNSTCQVFSSTGIVCYGVFFNYSNQSESIYGVGCKSKDNFDPDISGIGVVISFCASAIITTFASIAASLLDHIAASPKSLLPARWQLRNTSSALREKCVFMRRILERLILSLADQQLVTGFALLICAWVKMSDNPIYRYERNDLRNSDASALVHFPNLFLPTAQFSLVVFLCMASASSHLACVMVLREYMEEHKSAARLRIGLIITFAAFLAVTIALASSFTTYFANIFRSVFSVAVHGNDVAYTTYSVIFAFSIAVPLMVILGVSWLCTLQLMPSLKDTVRDKTRNALLKRLRKWFRLSKIWHCGFMRFLPNRWRDPFTRFFKRCFWFIVLGNELVVFAIQVVLAILSIVWITLQRLATPPIFYPEYYTLCSLHNVAGHGEMASFGQLLPIILLFLPVLSAYGTYVEERHLKRKSMGTYSLLNTPMLREESSQYTPRRASKPPRLPPIGDEAELELLGPRGHRLDSDASMSSYFSRPPYDRQHSQGSMNGGLGISDYDQGVAQSPQPIQSAYQYDPHGWRNRAGSMGWPQGCSTGLDEESQAERVGTGR